MDVSMFFLKFLVVLLTAKLFSEAFMRVGVPAVLGEVTAGIVMGPSILGFVHPESYIPGDRRDQHPAASFRGWS